MMHPFLSLSLTLSNHFHVLFPVNAYNYTMILSIHLLLYMYMMTIWALVEKMRKEKCNMQKEKVFCVEHGLSKMTSKAMNIVADPLTSAQTSIHDPSCDQFGIYHCWWWYYCHDYHIWSNMSREVILFCSSSDRIIWCKIRVGIRIWCGDSDNVVMGENLVWNSWSSCDPLLLIWGWLSCLPRVKACHVILRSDAKEQGQPRFLF